MAEHKIINAVSSANVPKWGNAKKYIAIHYLGVTGENHDIAPDGTGAHFYIYHDGTIYQRCDLNAIVWAVGTGGYYKQLHPDARNANTISIELCCYCDGDKRYATDPYWYFTTETQEAAVWLVQKLMKEQNIPISNVLRHGDITNKYCPAPYMTNNKYKTSWTWDEFKARVAGKEIAEPKIFRVAKAYENGKYVGQIGAYEVKQNAIDACKPGYKVFNKNGKVVHEAAAPSGTQAGDISSLATEAEKAAAMLELIRKTDKSGILWSLTACQMILESGYCGTELVQKSCNAFGLKTSLSGNNWKSHWDGKSTVTVKTSEDDGTGRLYDINAPFRAYPNLETSILDHSDYLLGAEKSAGVRRYAGIETAKTLEESANIVRSNGYATDTKYVPKLVSICQRYGLDKYDAECRALRPAAAPEPKAKKYQIQCGVFTNENHAKELSKKLSGRGIENIVVNDGGYRVIAGSFKNKAKAEKLVAQLKSKGFEAIIR